MRYPYERFLRFLVSRKVPVDRTLDRYGLPSVGALWEADCRTNIRKSAPYSVSQYIDADDDQELVAREGFIEWAEKEGFAPLWMIQREFGGAKPSPALDTAFQIFVNPHARAVVGMLLLSEVPSDEICSLVQTRFDLGVDEETLDLYTTIFWDIELLGRAGWQAFMAELKTKEERHYIGLGLGSPSSADARRYLGVEVNFDPEAILKDLALTAHTQYKACMAQPDPESAGALKWHDATIKAINSLGTTKKAFGGDDEIGASDFNSMFSVQIEKIQHVSLTELVGEVSPKDDNSKTPEEE